MEETDPTIRVLLRVRPLNARELHHSSASILQIEQGAVSLLDNGDVKSFSYDAVYGAESTQTQIFTGAKEIVDAVCKGYHGTIVAYGQTGSGKTHTIFGDDADAGLVQRSLQAIYDSIARSRGRAVTKASFLEIYNERVYDLLSPRDQLDEALAVREDASRGVYVENLSEFAVTNTQEAMEVLQAGIDNRKVASTNMNRVSSRSHALFVLDVKTEITEGDITKVRHAKFTLVDLAGSERQKTTDAAGERLKEASMINNSLLCLGQVINSLVDQQKRGLMKHAPFRDSKLTFLLKNSFGGNSKTCLVATVTPSPQSLAETVSTLKFAQRAKLIKNNATLNEDTSGSVPALQAEIARLKSELATRNDRQAMGETSHNESTDVTVMALRNQNSKLEHALATLKETRQHRETQVTSLKRKLHQETLIRKCKERRITYLSTKSDNVESREIAALQEEVAMLRDQLENGRNTEAIEWMMRYKEEKARLDEIESDREAMASIERQNQLESHVTALMAEKDELAAKLDAFSTEQNGELDAILAGLSQLEKDNSNLKAALDEKTAQAMQSEEKLRSDEAQLGELQEEVKRTMEYLEAAQSELSAEKTKSTELQLSVEGMKREVEAKSASIDEYRVKVAAAENEINQLNETHAKSISLLQSKIVELEKDVNLVMNENDNLTKKMKDASDELAAKQAELEALQREKEEMAKQLSANEEMDKSHLDAFKLKEEAFQLELKELKEKINDVVEEKTETSNKLDQISAENASLLTEVESFKEKYAQLKQQLAEMDDLEDTVMLVTIERDTIDEQLAFANADHERTLRFHREMSIEHDSDLATRDELINSLARERSSLQQELSTVTNQMAESVKEGGEKFEILQNEITHMKEEREAVNHQMEAVKAELESSKEQYAKSVAYIADHEEKLVSIQAEKDQLTKELEAAKFSLSESQATGAELVKFTERVAELEGMLEQLQADYDKLTEESSSLKSEIASGEEAKNELTELMLKKEALETELNAKLLELQTEKESLQDECELLKSTEKTRVDELQMVKDQLASLEKVHGALKQESVTSDEKAEAKLAEAEAEKSQLEKECSDLKSNLACSIDEVASLKGMLEAIGKDFDALKEETAASRELAKADLLKLQAEKERVESELTSLKESEVCSKHEVESLQGQLEAMQQKYDSLHEEFSASGEETKSELVSLRTENQRLGLECSTMKANEANADAEMSELKEKLSVLEKEYNALKKDSIESREKAKSELVALQAEKERLESECRAMKENDASASEEIAALKQKLANVENEYTSFQHEYNVTVEQTKSELHAVHAEKERLETKWNSMKDNEALLNEEVVALKQKLEAAERDYRSLKDEKMASEEQTKSQLLELQTENNRLQTECDAFKSNEANTSTEVGSLKDKLALLEQEYEALKEESSDKFQTNAVPSPSAPDANSIPEENTGNDSFLDDSFDEDMFLPNAGTPAQGEATAPPSTPQSSTCKQNDENNPPSPSKTPFQQRRALFSPKKTPSATKAPAKNTTTKKTSKRAIRASATPAKTPSATKPPTNTTATKKVSKRATRSSATPAAKTSPIKRVTRRSTRNLRTPLGDRND